MPKGDSDRSIEGSFAMDLVKTIFKSILHGIGGVLGLIAGGIVLGGGGGAMIAVSQGWPILPLAAVGAVLGVIAVLYVASEGPYF